MLLLCYLYSLFFLYNSNPFISGILTSRINKPNSFGLKLDNADKGLVYAPTSKLFISSIILNVEIMSASSSTSRILLGLTALLLPLVVNYRCHLNYLSFLTDTNMSISYVSYLN